MAAINITDLNNAKLDVDHIAAIATSSDPTATDRLGNSKQTISGILLDYPNATANAAAALASKVAAEGARDAAEAARDAAIVGSGLYTTEASGRAAVADGEYFRVAGSGDVAMQLYTRVSAGVSTLVTELASLAGLQSLSLARDFEQGANVLLRVVKKLRLYGADASKFYWVRYFFRDDSGVRFNFTIQELDDAAGAGAVDVASFSSSGASYTGQVEFTLSEVGASGISGAVVIDFTGAAAIWGIYAGSAATLIRMDTHETSAADTLHYQALAANVVTANAEMTEGLKLPFIDDLNNDFIRRLIKDVHLYGADLTHAYIFSEVEVQDFRCSFTIYDLTAGVAVCKQSVVEAIPDYNALEPIWRLDQGTLLDAVYRGMYAVIRIDWSEATTGTRAYTLATESGINATKVFSEEVICDYLELDHRHEIIKVAAGSTALRDAMEDFYDASGPTCARASYHHRPLLALGEGNFYGTYLTKPAFIDITGKGIGRTFIYRENTDPHALFEFHLEGKLADCTLISETAGEYPLHSDDSNRESIKGGLQVRNLRQSFKRVHFVGGAAQDGPLFGCGISSGQTILFEDCIADHLNVAATSAAYFFHNVGPTIATPLLGVSKDPARVIMRGCRSSDVTEQVVYLQSLEPGPLCSLELHGCEFNMIYETIAGGGEVVTDLATDRFGWCVSGVHAGPIVRVDPEGSLVLRTTPGAAVSGTAAALIFGAVDELGRGNKWVKTGTVKSLGARLGDCSSVSKALTIGAQTHTFNTNLTAASNATILAAMNATLTSNPVTEVDIQKEFMHDTGYTRRMLNPTGSTIAAGKFVKRTGANTIALATGDDDIFGCVHRDILDGLSGDVDIKRKVHTSYITGASSAGKFGVTAGLLDYGAAVKVGYIAGNIAHLYV
jgi:hypothetical protein